MSIRFENDISSFSTALAQKANSSDLVTTNTKIGNIGNIRAFKGSCLFASLPTTGMITNDFWYVSDKTSNYCYNGASWIDIGNNFNIGAGTITQDKTNFLIKNLSINLFDKTKADLTGNYNWFNGTFTANTDYVSSGLISVIPGNTYTHLNAGYVSFWNINNVFISGLNDGNNKTFVVPAGATAYVRIPITPSTINADMLVVGTVFPSTYVPYSETFSIQNLVVAVPSAPSQLNGLKWVILGDSISTDASGYATMPYWKSIGLANGMTTLPYAISGTRISVVSGQTNPFCTRFNLMDTTADIITVFGGTNDYASLVPMGTIDSVDDTTFMGAMNVLCLGLINQYVGKKIGFITPIQRVLTATNIPIFQTYVDAEKAVCDKYSIPCLDLFANSGLYPQSSAVNTAFYIDGLHLQNGGHTVIARKIQSFIESL